MKVTQYTLCTILRVDTTSDAYTGFGTDSPHSLLFSTSYMYSTKQRSKTYNCQQDLARLEHLHIISVKTTYISVNICINIFTYRINCSERLHFMLVYWQYANLFLDIILRRGGSSQFFKPERIQSVPSKQETLTQCSCWASVAEDGSTSHQYCVYVWICWAS